MTHYLTLLYSTENEAIDILLAEFMRASIQFDDEEIEGIKELIKTVPCISHDGIVWLTWNKNEGVSESYIEGSTQASYSCDVKPCFNIKKMQRKNAPKE